MFKDLECGGGDGNESRLSKDQGGDGGGQNLLFGFGDGSSDDSDDGMLNVGGDAG